MSFLRISLLFSLCFRSRPRSRLPRMPARTGGRSPLPMDRSFLFFPMGVQDRTGCASLLGRLPWQAAHRCIGTRPGSAGAARAWSRHALRGAQPGSADETYTIPVGKTKDVRDHYNSLIADFEGESGTKLSVEVRAFDDGVAFRYIVPEQPSIRACASPASVPSSATARTRPSTRWSLSGFQSSYEDDYQMRTVGRLHRDWLVALPLLAEVPGTGWVAITEANIDNYAGMYLRSDKPLFSLKAKLSPRVDTPGVAVDTKTPFNRPGGCS